MILGVDEKPSIDDLAHFGVKGMHWGVRKAAPASAPNLHTRSKGVTVRADGSISVKPGASLQRLVRSSGKSLPMKDLTYASLTDYDNARYIKVIGGKGLLGGGRDQILNIVATRKIEAPSKEEATRMVSDLLVHNAEFRAKNTNLFGGPITNRELARIKADPVGKDAQAWYEMTNTKMTFSAQLDKDAPYVQKALAAKLQAKGYNALRDENDVVSKISKAPIIIFSPEKSLKVTTVTNITDELRKANKVKLKQYKSMGKDWVDQQLYST